MLKSPVFVYLTTGCTRPSLGCSAAHRSEREDEHGRNDRRAQRAFRRGGDHAERRRLRGGAQGLQRHDRPAAAASSCAAPRPPTSSRPSTSRARTSWTSPSAAAGHSVPGFGTADDAVVIDLSGHDGRPGRSRARGRPAPRAAPPGASSTTRRTRTASRPPAASSRRPASAGSRSAAASATWREASGCPATTWSRPRW